MSIAQQIFWVFFAIFWGAVFSVQGRWRMFQPLLEYPHVRHRLFLSIITVNILPILFFAWTFSSLKGGALTDINWTFGETLRQTLAAVLPAFGIFGFYRLWMWIVELAPNYFYQSKDNQDPALKDVDPTIQCLHLRHRFEGWNFVFALGYLGVAFAGPFLR